MVGLIAENFTVRTLTTRLGAWEIKTLRLPDYGFALLASATESEKYSWDMMACVCNQYWSMSADSRDMLECMLQNQFSFKKLLMLLKYQASERDDHLVETW